MACAPVAWHAGGHCTVCVCLCVCACTCAMTNGRPCTMCALARGLTAWLMACNSICALGVCPHDPSLSLWGLTNAHTHNSACIHSLSHYHVRERPTAYTLSRTIRETITLDSQFGVDAFTRAHHILHDALIVSLVQRTDVAD